MPTFRADEKQIPNFSQKRRDFAVSIPLRGNVLRKVNFVNKPSWEKVKCFHPLAGKRVTEETLPQIAGEWDLLFPSPCGETCYGSIKVSES